MRAPIKKPLSGQDNPQKGTMISRTDQIVKAVRRGAKEKARLISMAKGAKKKKKKEETAAPRRFGLRV